MDFSTITLWTSLFPVIEVSVKVLLLPWFTEIPVFKANTIDLDQTPRSVASNLGLHCLPVSLFWDARPK